MGTTDKQRIVAIGGGTGLPVVLKSLQDRVHRGQLEVTAVVNVVDDGGSSGKIRRSLSTLPPGDIRNCLVATAQADEDLVEIFDYRFSAYGELDQHSLGNLIIAAMTKKTGGFDIAVEKAARLLDCWARILPATTEQISLEATTTDGRQVKGQANIALLKDDIDHVGISPQKPQASNAAVEAIMAADTIIVGPGSLYSSIIPALLVPEIHTALRSTDAKAIYICNTISYRRENLGYSLHEHLAALEVHLGAGLFDQIIAQDPSLLPQTITAPNGEIALPVPLGEELEPSWCVADVADDSNPAKHSPDKLISTLFECGIVT